MLLSYHLRGVLPRAVERVAAALDAPAYMSQTGGIAWISLYPDRPGHPADLHRTAEMLSAGAACPVWGVLVQPGAVLYYVVYDAGRLEDEYCSPPDHFGPVSEARRARLGGKPAALRNCAAGVAAEEEFSRVLSGRLALGAQEERFKERVRQTIRSTSSESIGLMLGVAAQQLGRLDPDQLSQMLRQAGVPLDHPMLAPFLRDPAGVLRELAANPAALELMKQQAGDMSEAALQGTEQVEIPPELRLAELGRLLGLEAQRLALSYELLKSGAPVGYQAL